MSTKTFRRTALALLGLLGALAGLPAASAADAAAPAAASAMEAPAAAASAPAGAVSERLVRNGLMVDFTMTPAGKSKTLMEGDFADVVFAIKDPDGKAVRTSAPGAWLDMAQVLGGRPEAEQKSCKDKISLYLKGAIGIRPMVDLNSHYVVLMNADASIAVVDPTVSMAGSTSTLASLVLKSPGSDWVPVDRLRRLFVTQPKAGAVAVVDTENFKVIDQLEAGKQPVRVVLQPDGRFLWVGNNANDEADSGVTVIDTESAKVVGFVATGMGHHEITFSADSRFAFVTNRQSGTLSVIDVGTRKVVKQIATGAQPLSVGYSALSQAVYVADGKEGHVSIIDAQRHVVTRKVALKPGLGPLRVSPNGRFVLALNPREDLVSVIDTASQEAVHDIAVAGEPFQLNFTETYAYVRAMHSERVSMINLSSLGKGLNPAVQYLAIGSQPPAAPGGVAIADSVAVAKGDGTVFIVNPSDGNTYYYMEGMSAPSTNYRVYGSSPRAVTVVDRSLKEVQPGVFSGRVRIPAPGKYDVAFMMQSPAVLHCFTATAIANPALESQLPKLAVEFITKQREFKVGEAAAVRFKLTDPRKQEPVVGLKSVTVMSFLSPGRRRTEIPATEVEPGVYEAKVSLPQAGGWYVHVGVPSMKLGYKDLGFYSLLASEPSVAKAGGAAVNR